MHSKATWKLTSEQRDQIVTDYLAGAATPDLAEKNGLLESSVRSLLRRRGVTLRPQNYNCKLTEERLATVVAALREGCSLQASRIRAGVSPEPFYDWLKKGRAGRGGLYGRLVQEVESILGGISAHSRCARVYKADEFFFDNIDSDRKAYWLGMMATDGWVSKNEACLKFASRDRDHLQLFLDALSSNAPINDYPARHCPGKLVENSGPQSGVRIGSKRLVESLASLGVTPAKSFTVRPWQGPDDLMHHYWRGAVDGDGFIVRGEPAKGRTRAQFGIGLCGNRFMVEGFSSFVNGRIGSCGCMFRKRNTWYVQWKGNRITQRVAAVLYEGATVALRRKADLIAECMALTVQRDWSHLDARVLEDLKAKHGSWAAVARSLGIAANHLHNLRARFAPV